MGEIKKCVLCFSKKWGEIEERGERDREEDWQTETWQQKEAEEARRSSSRGSFSSTSTSLLSRLSRLSLCLSLSLSLTHTHTHSHQWHDLRGKAAAHHMVALLLSSCDGGCCADDVCVWELAGGCREQQSCVDIGEGKPPVVWPHLPWPPPHRLLRQWFQHLRLLP